MSEEVKLHTCSSCGAEMEFDISAQALKCPFCNQVSEERPKGVVMERDFSNPAQAEAQSRWQSSVTSITCETCGAEILVEPAKTVACCAFCGSDHVLRTKQAAGIPPDGIVPFQVDKNEAKGKFLGWITKRFWAPRKLKELFQADKMEPVYLPYWTFDAHADCPYTAEGGEVYYVTVGSGDKKRRERRVRWYHVRGRLHHFFDDILISARQKAWSFINKLESFNTKAAQPFSPIFLAGFAAEKYTVSPQTAYQEADRKMRGVLESMAATEVRRRYDEVRFVKISPYFYGITFKHLLLPFWITAFMYENKLYNVAINAQTGQIHGQYPISKVKVAFAVLLGIVILAAILVLAYFYQNSQ